MCECVVERRSNHSDNTERKKTWLPIASDTDFQRVKNLKRLDVTDFTMHAKQK